MKFFDFLKYRKFYLHFFLGIVLAFLLLWLVLSSLNMYTHHGEAISLPDYSGIAIDSIDHLPNEHNFTFIVTDSIYDSKRTPGTIIMQNPLVDSKVKRNRKIYLTIIAKMPEMVHMPNLVDLSLRQSLVTLDAEGLKVNSLQYIPDFAENAVLAQLYNGDTILPDSLLQRGSKVDLILGKGYNPRKLSIPFLIGMPQKDVQKYLNRSSLNIGEEIYLDSLDGGIFRVYMQEPSWKNDSILNYGDFISLWYRSDFKVDFNYYIDSIRRDTLEIDSLNLMLDSLQFESIMSDSLYFEEL